MRKFLLLVLIGALVGGCAQATPVPATPATTEVPKGLPVTPAVPVTGSPQVPPMEELPLQPIGGPGAKPGGWEPQTGDEALIRGSVFLDAQQLVTLESNPPQYQLALTGSLPTPCNQLRVKIADPDDQKRIQVEVYSLSDRTSICVQVLSPFSVNIPLKPLPAGTYTVLVNNKPVGEIKF